MTRTALALFLGALATTALFFVIDQADRAVPPPQPTPVVPPTIMLAPGSSEVYEFSAPFNAAGGEGPRERPPALTPRPSDSVRHRPTATSLARALAFASSPSTVAAETLLLASIPSDVPDIVAEAPDRARGVEPRTDGLPLRPTPRSGSEGATGDAGAPSRGGIDYRGPGGTGGEGSGGAGRNREGGAPPRLPAPHVGLSRTAVPRRTPEPRYPERIRARGGEGTVSARITIDAAGLVSNIEVLGASGDAGLRAHVIETIRGWTFDPALTEGLPVTSTLVRRFVFRLMDP